ncbi:PIG-X [Microdochium trichocladiopsis]|uniref:Protein PBN1 n=1 Tax=Microdochium trichocladiopsis TaxID=1682393 RepID=A0A9P9BUL4_9PEZI|nr:PIG-X [Microdochium trichocladiopsis]KAH7041096.1 PIG-X [Microdochium trichocladiopsis]
MRQRTTFFHHNDDGVEPADLKITSDSLSGPDLVAIREDKITLDLQELPGELRELLARSSELHLRWESPRRRDATELWPSRVTPGLHVFYTPRSDDKAETGHMCRTLRNTFGVMDCQTPKDSFTKLPKSEFKHSAAYHYYHPLSDLKHFGLYAGQYACGPSDSACAKKFASLDSATSFDFSYDASVDTVKASIMWPRGKQPLSLTAVPGHRLEVGIMTPDAPPYVGPDELGVAGLLVVLGEHQKPNPTLFAFPARHKASRVKFASRFLSPAGLHPSLQLKISSAKPPINDESCSMYAHLTLPRTIFGDRYQLQDDLFLASKNLTALRYMSEPVDLEAPDYVMKLWGSSILLELKPPQPTTDQPWTAEVPLHLRYLAPTPGGYQTISIPYPALFWACEAEQGIKFTNSPFDRPHVGYDSLFSAETLFWHIDPQPERTNLLTNDINVPVLNTEQATWVNAGTTLVVMLGFGWILWKLVWVAQRSGLSSKTPNELLAKKQQ